MIRGQVAIITPHLIINKSMGFNRVRQLVKKIDMFSTSDLLRYKDEPEYATMTGTVLTIGIIVVIAMLVYQVVIHTVRKDDISWKQQITKQVVPEDLTVNMGQMKFGISLSDIDLNDETISYFDVHMYAYQTWKNGTSTSQEITLVECNASDWNDSQQMRDQFDQMDGETWLCPSQSSSAQIGGRWSGKYEKRFEISVGTCGSLNASKTNCANSTQMTAMWNQAENQIYASTMIRTTNVQPEQQNPIEHFIEDSNFIIFTQTVAQKIDIEISQYEIETDHSLLPFKDVEKQEGAMLSGVSKNYNLNPDQDFYARFDFKKSATKFAYSRSFHKIDETISYAGGLIGVVVGLFFLMSPYTELCYQLSLANQLFVDEEGKPVETSCNFISYMLFYGYTFLNLCCKCVTSKRFDLYDQCSDHMAKQLDISYILKRINNLQRSVHPTKGYKKMTFDQAEKKAEDMFPKQPSSQGSIKDAIIPYHDNTSTLRNQQTPQNSQDLKSIQVLPSSRSKGKKTRRKGWEIEVESSIAQDM